ADKVVRATKRPVALIRAKGARPDVREKGILNKALVPLDGSKEGEAVIPYIEELASGLKAEVLLLQVGPSKADTEDYLEKVSDRLKSKGITTRFEVRVGDAAGEIIKLADEIDADVVAMSTHGRSGIGRWALGSVAERVLNARNTPLLLVRAPGASTD
ncbi:MAG: universal stress protein, partial [Dehalococcoidia bacterium]|nr:universal stress protein [Dehalococcoidia bacterium]